MKKVTVFAKIYYICTAADQLAAHTIQPPFSALFRKPADAVRQTEDTMTIDKKLENTKLTVSLTGKLNTITSPQLDAALADLDGITELVLDLEELEQIWDEYQVYESDELDYADVDSIKYMVNTNNE